MNPNFYIYKKNFLIKNNIFFKKGFYEDILFVLKVFTQMKKYNVFKKKIYIKVNSKKSITNSCSIKHVQSFTKTSVDKLIYFKKNIQSNFKNVYFDDLQYGLRGDFIFINNMVKKIKVPKIFKNLIFSIYSNIVSHKFSVITDYDKKVLRMLEMKKFIN